MFSCEIFFALHIFSAKRHKIWKRLTDVQKLNILRNSSLKIPNFYWKNKCFQFAKKICRTKEIPLEKFRRKYKNKHQENVLPNLKSHIPLQCEWFSTIVHFRLLTNYCKLLAVNAKLWIHWLNFVFESFIQREYEELNEKDDQHVTFPSNTIWHTRTTTTWHKYQRTKVNLQRNIG